jgi:hypothetical protein
MISLIMQLSFFDDTRVSLEFKTLDFSKCCTKGDKFGSAVQQLDDLKHKHDCMH